MNERSTYRNIFFRKKLFKLVYYAFGWISLKYCIKINVTISQHHNVVRSKLHNITMSQHHNVIILQRHNVTTSKRHNVIILQRHNVTMSQHHNVIILQRHNVTMSQHQNVIIWQRHYIKTSWRHKMAAHLSLSDCVHMLVDSSFLFFAWKLVDSLTVSSV